jgi:hypothetical protein
MHWKSASPARSADGNLMVGTTTIRVRINVMPLAAPHPGAFIWRCRRSSPGPSTFLDHARAISAGATAIRQSRAGVFRPDHAAFMEDTLTFQFSVNGALMRRAVPVTYHFEMDED